MPILNKDSKHHILIPLFIVLFLWLCFWLQYNNIINWRELGVFPREKFGLYGIVLSPFIHANLQHLLNNTISLLFLLLALGYFYPSAFYKVLIFSVILSGIGTWFIGRPSFHVGASGVIYALVSFLFFKGILSKHYRLMALSFLVVFQYGGMIWYMFADVETHISWEGHLSGFIAGAILALAIATPVLYKEIKYDWEHPDFNPALDPFMKHFDAKGKFKNNPNQHATYHENKKIVYHIVAAEEED